MYLSTYDSKVINETEQFARSVHEGEGTGHDWHHIERVWNTSKYIQKQEGGNIYIVELGALLHDIDDWKFQNEKNTSETNRVKMFLTIQKVPMNIIDKVCHIVDNISFKGSGVENKIKSLEGMIVQDADRLDALGAIGIARAFAYGGFKQRLMYDPDVDLEKEKTEDYTKQFSPSTIHHFYDKLLLIKDKMNTKTGKKLAKQRHEFMKMYLEQFFNEWKGQA